MRSTYVFKYILKKLGAQAKAQGEIYMSKTKETAMKHYVTNAENITGVWWSGGVPLFLLSLCHGFASVPEKTHKNKNKAREHTL